MATRNQTSQEALCAEILADSGRQSEELVRGARQDANALLGRAAAEAEKARQQRLELARAEATRRKKLILAAVPVETGRLRAARIEALLKSIYAEARRRLTTRHGFDYRKTLVALAAEAIGQMAGAEFVVKLSVADRAALGGGLAEEIARRSGRLSLKITLSDDPTITEPGLIVQDVESRQVWDNRLLARLERLWPELRRQLAVHCSLVEQDVAGGAPRFAPDAVVAAEERSADDKARLSTATTSPILVARSDGGAQ